MSGRIETTGMRGPRESAAGGRARVVGAVAARELRDHLSSARFRLLLVTTLVLVVVSTLAGAFNYRVQAEQYQIMMARAGQKLREATTWSEVQPIMVRPPAPLMVLNAGFDAKEGRIAIASNSQIPAKTEDAPVGTPYLARFGGFDVTTVIVYLLGLLAILLSFDAVSGERERGTLSLSLSNALARWQLFYGKWLGGVAALALSLAASLAAALLVLIAGGVPFHRSAWPRVGLLFVALLLYLSAMFTVGLLVSVLTRRPAVSLLVGMLAWFVLVVFIPVAATSAAGQLARSPSPYELTAEMARLDEELEQKSADARKALGGPPESEGLNVSMENGVSMSFYSPEAYEWWLRYYAERVRLEREYAVKVYERTKEFQDRNRAQAALAFRLSSLSPVAHLERAADGLTGTSREDVYYFLEASRRYRQDLIAYYDRNHLTASLRWITDDPPNQPAPFAVEPEGQDSTELGREMYARVLAERKSGARALPIQDLPRFEFSPRPVGQALGGVLTSLAALTIINLLCAAVAFARFRTYDVRLTK